MATPPPGNPKPAEEKKETSDAPEREVERLISAISGAHRANRAATRARDKKNECKEKWKFKLEIAGFFLVFAYATFTGWEAWTFHTESHTMDNEFSIAQTNSVLEQRAWVTITATEELSSDSVVVGAQFLNSGKTPGIADKASISLATGDDRPSKTIFQTNFYGFAIAPNFPYQIPEFYVYPFTNLENMTLWGNKNRFLDIKITYLDLFENTNTTECCWRIDRKPYAGTWDTTLVPIFSKMQ